MNPTERRLDECQHIIGYYFSNPLLIETALTHSSLRAPDRECNERLEFLGDSVLGLVITEELYHLLPDQSEGELTRIKSAVVSRSALLSTSQRLGLQRFAEFARGVGKRDKLPASVVANLVEAIIGAIYLDAGYYPAREFVLRHMGGAIDDELNDRGAKNYKSLLQHEVQQSIGVTPTYRTIDADGPDHEKEFVVAAIIRGQEWGRANGPTKKDAEQDAARLALEAWERRGRGRRRRRKRKGDDTPEFVDSDAAEAGAFDEEVPEVAPQVAEEPAPAEAEPEVSRAADAEAEAPRRRRKKRARRRRAAPVADAEPAIEVESAAEEPAPLPAPAAEVAEPEAAPAAEASERAPRRSRRRSRRAPRAAESDATPAPEPEVAPAPEPEVAPAPEPEAQPEAVEPRAEEAESAPRKPRVRRGRASRSRPKAESESQPDSKPEPKPEAKSPSEPKPEPQPESKPQPEARATTPSAFGAGIAEPESTQARKPRTRKPRASKAAQDQAPERKPEPKPKPSEPKPSAKPMVAKAKPKRASRPAGFGAGIAVPEGAKPRKPRVAKKAKVKALARKPAPTRPKKPKTGEGGFGTGI